MTHAAVVHDLRPAERSGPRASDTLIRGRRVLPYPDGWFAVCFSHELKRGDVRTVPFMGQELVVYRTHAGEAFAVEPFARTWVRTWATAARSTATTWSARSMGSRSRPTEAACAPAAARNRPTRR